MRFRADLSNPDHFLRIIQAIERNGKSIVLFLTPEKVNLCLVNDATSPKLWTELNVASLFTNYVIESLAENKIFLQLDIINLSHALRSGQRNASVNIRLTKKNQLPVLSLRIKPLDNDHVQVTQDLPVQVLQEGEFDAAVDRPVTEIPDVQIMLPSLKPFHDVVDRYRNLGDELVICANMDGNLNVRMETPHFNAGTYYRDLVHPPAEGQQPPKRDPEKTAQVRVDIRKLERALRSYQLNPLNAVACLFHNRFFMLHILVDDLYMTYLIPCLIV
eukprot:gnl/Trimastix_PCT/3247.p1 GENE.gnl/Trimastix_PCT/3247~~gnl/Trimastix_PCT/3247.p1  ORF type:complete len:285 (+),score=91.56 gnl/Trimastix_PCT/3247:34-855(+)